MAGAIDPTQPIPIYFQLKTLLLEEILSGRYDGGARLPTEHELCARFGISRTPVKRALSQLADEGVVLRTRRRGTFVNPHWAQRQPNAREVRIVVPEGPWRAQIEDAVPRGMRINVATVPLPDLHQVVAHAVAEGRAPDLAVLDSVWVPEFAAARFLWPIDELDGDWLAREYEHDFLEPFVSANRFDERTVAVQAEADVAGLWYRRDALASAGVGPPSSWDELIAAARAISRSGIPHPVVFPGGSRGGETTTYCLLALLAANGVAVIGPSGVTLDVQATSEALSLLRSLVRRRLSPPDVVGYEWDRAGRLLAHGQAAIAFGGSYEARSLAEAAALPFDSLLDAFGFAAMPTGPRGRTATLAGGMVYAVFRQAAYPELAMRLLERLVSADALARMSRTTAQIPSRRSAVDLVTEESPLLSTTAAMLAHAVVRPAMPSYPRVSAQLQTMLEAVLTGRLDAARAVSRAADMIGAITGLPVVR
jgi:multiple sugar transport system substrate-binding protein